MAVRTHSQTLDYLRARGVGERQLGELARRQESLRRGYRATPRRVTIPELQALVHNEAARHHRAGARARPGPTRGDWPGGEAALPPTIGGEGLEAFLAALSAIEARVHAAGENFVRQGGQLIANQAKVNASTGAHARGQGHIKGTGPGPNRISGDLVRSIVVAEVTEQADGSWEATIGPAIIYGRAIELGMFRPPHGYSPGASPRAIRLRHPGFGGIYPYMEPAVQEMARGPLPALWDEKMRGALGG